MSDVELIVVDEGVEENKTPDILTEEQKEELKAYLSDEYTKAKDAFAPRNLKIAKWRAAVEAFSKDAAKTHPFKSGSHIRVPVMQMLTEGAFAKVLGTFNARDKLWIVSSQKDDEIERKKAKVLTNYLSILTKSESDLDMANVNADALMDTIIAGTTLPKVVWSKNSWKVRENGVGSTEKEVVAHIGPEVVTVPLDRVFYRKGTNNINKMPWIATDIPMTEPELRQKAAQGIFTEVEKVLENGGRDAATDVETEQNKSEDAGEDVGLQYDLYDITEFYVFWDVDGTGVPYDLVVHMHVPSNTVLSVQYNSAGYRLMTPLRFVHRQYSITGRGLGQKLESLQVEADAIHNVRNDNMKLANMRMIVTRRGVLRGASIDYAYAGKNIEVDVPKEDIAAFQLGEIYPSSLQAEGQTLDYAYRASAMSETMMGLPTKAMGSRDTARGQAMRLQTGDSLFGVIVDGMTRAYAKIGMMVVIQLITHRDEVLSYERERGRLNEEDLGILAEALNIGIEDISRKFNFSVQTEDVEQTMEVKRQNLLTLTQLFAQFAQQTIPLALQLFGPQGQAMQQQAPDAWQYMMRILTGANLMMSDIFKFFGEEDAQNYVPDGKKFDAMLDTLTQMRDTLAGPTAFSPPAQAQIISPEPQTAPMAPEQGVML